jgi:hypothetical protein
MGKKLWVAIAVIVLALAMCGIGATLAGGDDKSDRPSGSSSIGAAPDTGHAEVVEAKPTITDGTWRVSDEVKPGTYTATVPEGGLCYYARLRGFSGDPDELISNEVGQAGERVRVTIKKTDAGFETHDCGEWVRS